MEFVFILFQKCCPVVSGSVSGSVSVIVSGIVSGLLCRAHNNANFLNFQYFSKVMNVDVVRQLEKEFMENSFGMSKAMGMPELHARLAGVLFLQNEPIPLEELAKKAGYSLSSTSTAMRFLENIGRVQRIRKPGSKKVYYKMEHDIAMFMKQMFRKVREKKIVPTKEFIPKMIKKYEKQSKNNKELKEKLDIIKKSYDQMLKVDKIMKKIMDELEKI